MKWGMTLVFVLATAAGAQAQHSKRDAAKLASDMDAILRKAYDNKPHPARAQKPAAKPIAKTATVRATPPDTAKDSSQPAKVAVVAPARHEDSVVGAVIVDAFRLMLEPDEIVARMPHTPAQIEAHLARLPKTPEEVAQHLARLPKTPEEVAQHLRNLPKSPAEVDAHLRRLDAALSARHR